MNSAFSFKNDFVNKLKSMPQEVKFLSDDLKLNSFDAFDYYYNSIILKINKENLCAFICNSSIESTIISFFLILDNIKIIFLSSDQKPNDIKNVILENSINELIVFENQLTNQIRNEIKNIRLIKIKTIKDFTFNKKNQELFFNKFSEYAESKSNISIFMSSGSTAIPKLIPLDYKNINYSYKSIKNAFMANLDYSRIICIHDTSFVIVINFLQAFCAVKSSKLYGIDFNNTHLSLLTLAKSINENSKDIIITVPSVYAAVVSLIDNFGINNLENKSLISCGEPLTYKLAKTIFNKKPNNFLNLYGSTELASWVLWLDILDFLNKSNLLPSILPVGKPLPGMNLKLGKNNELTVNSDCVFNGYLKINNNDIYIQINSQRFFKTGDQFLIIDDLYHCQGRLNNAIKIGGRFVNPTILESELKCSFDFSNVLVISDQKNLSLKVLLFVSKMNKNISTIEIVKTKIYKTISNKINVKIKFISENAKCLRSGKIDRKYYKNLDF